jgi:large subunit ribosomal protein L4
MKLNVYALDGNKTEEKVELNNSVFGVEPNDHAIYMAVRLEEANKRQGTHMARNRALVSGGGKKPFRQKGTGRARQGTTRAPHMRGGGSVFGPMHNRDYGFRLPKKVKKLARISALSYKAKNKNIIVTDDFVYDKRQTREVVNLLNNFELNGTKTMLITADLDRNLVKSASNVIGLTVRENIQFSTRDVLNAKTIIIQKSAVGKLNEALVR